MALCCHLLVALRGTEITGFETFLFSMDSPSKATERPPVAWAHALMAWETSVARLDRKQSKLSETMPRS